ncbi:hypothetical protein VNI00_000340 [Paramarasmius palmivorus]|uniref:SAP domain-containing protein n=1 Tax=Paramarasmius palmivorus TaxID=297713 RepID=A0AAW0EEY3_9AGAR
MVNQPQPHPVNDAVKVPASTMSTAATTTEILFNSPALHSLKRDQLVKLCKIHSIKASGKNVELIARLKQVAETLPKDSALSIAARSEETQEEDEDDKMAVDEKEDTLAEMGESSSQGTLASQGTMASHRSGEFGTANSKGTLSSSSSVSSSIKALASSLGLKRSVTTKSTNSTVSTTSTLPPLPVFPRSRIIEDELTRYSKPYSAFPPPSPSTMPKHDNFAPDSLPTAATLAKFDFHNAAEPEPLPGHILRPGMPAPQNARLSMGQTAATPGGKPKTGPTTTIRLISNSSSGDDASSFSWSAEIKPAPGTPQLKPFKPTFDLVMGSPGGANERIYPALPMDDLVYDSPVKRTGMGKQVSETLPGALPSTSSTTPPETLAPPTEPIIFGSPNPRNRPSVTNDQFKTSMLELLNQKLAQEGTEQVDASLIRPGVHTKLNVDGSPRMTKPLPKPRTSVTNRFDRMHEKEFAKMEGIDAYMNRKNAVNGIVPSAPAPVAGRKRKSSVLGPQADGGSVAAVKKPKPTVPGGFGDDDDDESEEERGGKKARVEFAEGKKGDEEEIDDEQERERLQKEREAIRRKLAMNREKRRSSGRVSVGRVSTGGPRKSGLRLQKAPPKPAPAKSRFGFGFVSSAAKTLVRGVWGSKKEKPATEVAVSTTTTTTTSGPAIATSSSTASGLPRSQGKASLTSIPAGAGHQRKPSSGLNVPPAIKPRVASGTSTVSSMGTLASTTSRSSAMGRSRSPIPVNMRNGTASTRNSVVGAPPASSSRMSSLGTGRPSGSVRGSIASNAGAVTGSTKSRSSGTTFLPSAAGSRLLAPTASSLAKAQNSVNKLRQMAPVPTEKPAEVGESTDSDTTKQKSRIFGTITNAAGAKSPPPGTPGKIFSKPLVVPPGSGIPSPVRSGSITSGASGAPTRQKSLVTRKPRISRSRVIAKLASQRVASNSSTATSSSRTSGLNADGSANTRSSLGPRVGGGPAPRKSGVGARRSHVGVGGGRREARESAVMLSAKKRARQSEYQARRRSRASGVGARLNAASMDVDDD